MTKSEAIANRDHHKCRQQFHTNEITCILKAALLFTWVTLIAESENQQESKVEREEPPTKRMAPFLDIKNNIQMVEARPAKIARKQDLFFTKSAQQILIWFEGTCQPMQPKRGSCNRR